MTETIPYEVTGHLGEVELRRYPAILLVSVQGLEENEAFWVLFRYISGNNRPGKKVPMTAPVLVMSEEAIRAKPKSRIFT